MSSPTASKAKPRGLRAALRKRAANMTTYRMPLVSLEEALAIKQELDLARNTEKAGAFLMAREGDNEETRNAVEASKKAVEVLEKRYEECFYQIRFVALPADEFDALVQMHPPTPAQIEEAAEKGEDPPLWNDDSFYPELLERCALDSELSAAEWVEELRPWARAERAEIRGQALKANVRSYSTSLSFG